MIVIGKPYVVNEDTKSKLVCDITVDDEVKTIYLEVDKEYGKYLCAERCDGFLIVLFYYAMRNGHDIVCKEKVSEDLFYQITEYLIPLLQKNSHDNLFDINIICKTAPNIKNGHAVGTSATCGVDSFYTIYNNINNKLKTKKLTHLTIMNIADSYKKEGRYTLIKDKVYEKAEILSKELNLPLIKINSNMRDEFPIPPMHTLIRLFGVYSLQKLFGTYYFSSGYPVWTFNMEDTSLIDCARYDLLLCKELSTKNLFIYSEGSQLSRLEKLESIAKYDLVQKNLHVCVDKEFNCGLCSKCVRTILALDSIDMLEEFSDVFDVEFYHNNIDFYFKEALKLYSIGDIYVYDYINKIKSKYNHEILQQIPDIVDASEKYYIKSDYQTYLNNKKTIIGVTGGSSSGKSTVVSYLSNNLDGVDTISVDDYMIKYLDVYKKQIIDTLKIPNDGRHWCNHIYDNRGDVEEWVNIIKPEIDKSIKRDINNSKNKVIVVDSFMLPLLEVFKKCDYKINVKSELDKKLPRVKKRLKIVGRDKLFNDDSLVKRLENTKLSDSYSGFDFVIDNNGDTTSLSTNCTKVLKKLKKKAN